MLINQKLEVIDGTFDVWIYFREAMVDWLFDIFVRSADRAAQRKMNSFVLFKCNMEDLKKGNNDFFVMLMNVYARMKNLIYDDIPKIVWETKYNMPNPLPKDKLMHLSPEEFKKLKANQDIRDNINEWVEDTLFACILRKRYDHSDKDKTLLYLYRLLAIKYRITYPLKGESFKLDDDLRIVLESKICNAAMAYFNTPTFQEAAVARAGDRYNKPTKPAAGQSAGKPRSRSSGGAGGTGGKAKANWASSIQPAPPGYARPINKSGYSSDYLKGGQQQLKPPNSPPYQGGFDPAQSGYTPAPDSLDYSRSRGGAAPLGFSQSLAPTSLFGNQSAQGSGFQPQGNQKVTFGPTTTFPMVPGFPTIPGLPTVQMPPLVSSNLGASNLTGPRDTITNDEMAFK